MSRTKKSSAKRPAKVLEPSAWIVVLVILSLALVFRLAFAEGPLFDESLTLAGDAKALYSFDSAGTGSAPGIFAGAKEFLKEIRTLPSDSWPSTILLGLLYAIFGVSDLISLMPSLLAALLAGYLIWVLGAQMFDAATGLLAAFLWAIVPLSVFLSISLLPVLPLVAINLLVVTLFLRATQDKQWGGYLPAALLAAIGVILDWTFFLPTAIFMVIYLLEDRQVSYLREIGSAAALMVMVAFIFLGGGAAAVELYGLNLLLFDNFLILPLLVISLVFAAGAKRDISLHFLLLWLGVKAAFIFIFAPIILEKPLLQVIGFGGYWLDLIPPALILIAFQFARRLDPLRIKRSLLVMGLVAIAGLLILIPLPSLPAMLVTVLRVSVGLAFLCIFLYLAFWREGRPLANAIFMGALLIFLTMASVSIVNNYVGSYVYAVEDAREVRATLEALDGDPVVFVGDDFLYERLLYLGQFQNPHRLDDSSSAAIFLLNPTRAREVPTGAYVLVSNDYLNFVLGITPTNWEIFREFNHSSQQKLIMYQVGG